MIQNLNQESCGLCGSPLYLQHREGNRVCKACGTVSESRIVDQTAEYRCFRDDDRSSNPIRVGGQVNFQMSRQIDLIVLQDQNNLRGKAQFRGMVASEDAYYVRGISIIKKYCSLLDLQCLQKPSIDLFTEIKDEASIRGKRQETTMAAVVFLAGRRTLNLIDLKSFVNIADTSLAKLLKACSTIVKLIPRIVVKPFELIKKYAQTFGLGSKEMTLVERLCSQIEEADVLDGRLPKNTTIAASVLYFYSLHHPSFKMSLSEIKERLGVENDSLIRSYVASISTKKDLLLALQEAPEPSPART